jgi:hypothetical protein
MQNVTAFRNIKLMVPGTRLPRKSSYKCINNNSLQYQAWLIVSHGDSLCYQYSEYKTKLSVEIPGISVVHVDGERLRLRTAATNGPTVHTSETTQAANPGPSSERPATTGLSHGTTRIQCYSTFAWKPTSYAATN